MIILSFFHFSIEFHEIYLTSGIISVFPTVKFSNLEKFNFLNSSILWNVINHYHSFRIDSKTKFNVFLKFFDDPRSINRSSEFSLSQLNKFSRNIVLISSNFCHTCHRKYCSREEKWKFSNVRQSKVHPPPLPLLQQLNVLPSQKKGSRGQTSALGCMHPCYASRHYIPAERSILQTPPSPNCIRRQYTPSSNPFSLFPRPFLSLSIEPSRRNDVIYPAYLMKPLKTAFKPSFQSFRGWENAQFPLPLSLSLSQRPVISYIVGLIGTLPLLGPLSSRCIQRKERIRPPPSPPGVRFVFY